jgi:hypothetical protein
VSRGEDTNALDKTTPSAAVDGLAATNAVIPPGFRSRIMRKKSCASEQTSFSRGGRDTWLPGHLWRIIEVEPNISN